MIADIQVPVCTSGESLPPPAISFAPRYLAGALAIGPVLRLIDGISPGLTTTTTAGSSGNGTYGMIVPCRITGEAAEACDKTAGPAPTMAA
jgi:hypothetical protein